MRRLVIAALLVGCGGSPEPAPDNETDPPTSGDEAAAEDWSLDGTWFVYEADDEDVEIVLELNDGAGTAWQPRRPDERATVRVGGGEDGFKEMVLQRPDGREERALWLFQAPGRAVLFQRGDDDLVLARRALPMPEALLGEWEIVEPDDGDERFVMSVGAERVQLTAQGETHAGRVWGLGSAGEGTHTIVLEVPDGSRPELAILQLQRVNDSVWLAWPNADDDFRVMFRPGSRPSWVGERRRSAPPPQPVY